MLSYRALQLAKNGLYRVTGEAVNGVAGRDDGADRTLRVLMYHKVNDLSPNPITVPTVFAEQNALLRTLGYVPVSLDAVGDHYVLEDPASDRAVLVTFDGGYRDNLRNAFPILREHGFPAVIFAPIAYLDDSRPLPHEEALLGLGVENPTLDWDELAELEAGGVRIESCTASDTAARRARACRSASEIAISKLRLEERLGREVDAYAYVKDPALTFAPSMQASYSRPATSSRSRQFRARTAREAIVSSCSATTSSPIRPERSSSSWPVPATPSPSRTPSSARTSDVR